MRSITDVVNQFKQNWTQQLSETGISDACRDSGMTWNDSRLDPITVVQIFFLQILHGNTACVHMPRLTKMTFTAAGYCKARTRVTLEALRLLLCRSVQQIQKEVFDTGRWLGHRVFHVDGSSFSMPDTAELQNHFGKHGLQKPECGFPTAHWLVLLHAGTGMITKMLASPLRTHDMSKTVELHPELQRGDLLVADRGFCSYVHLALLLQRGSHGLLRIHRGVIVDFTPGRRYTHPAQGATVLKKGLPRSRWIQQLGENDQVVMWLKPKIQPGWMNDQQFATIPDSIVVRELRYTIHEKGFRAKEITLVTTLTDSERYSLSSLADLFRQRWEIETNFGHLKTTMKMDVLKCKTVDGVLKELQVFALIYNLVRQVMLEAATRQQVPVHQISFIDAMRWLQTADPGDGLPKLVVNPHRPNRLEPRVKKRRPKAYMLMSKPRSQLKKDLASK